MSTHESCPECQKQREALLIELFPEKLQSECGEWSLTQLQFLKKTVAKNTKSQTSIANSTAEQSAQNKLTIGQSLFGLKMSENPGQSNIVNPGAPIGNQLFNKKMNEM